MKNSEVTFSLPFDGEWLVFWGGDTAEQNHHSKDEMQEFAFDFVKVDDRDSFFGTNGKDNNDYYSYGSVVHAPASGEVVEVVNGARDNKPKELNGYNAFGNYVMIKHDERTYSVLCHLKKDSTEVKEGTSVKAGDRLALCGNSGNTTDSHLHFHVQDSAVFTQLDDNYDRIASAKGKKIYFSRLRVNGDVKTNYSPVKGDKIANA